jgi:dTDP-4-dehydrorhamnose 3,5-epimerase
LLFSETKLSGVFIIEPEPQRDERGYFARTWCEREFQEHGLDSRVAQCNVSYSAKKGTLRGMHYQIAPRGEAKLVRCVRGAIYDVVIDLRPLSSTFRQWIGVELSDVNHLMLFIPQMFAHGFQTMRDQTEVFYQMSEFYSPECGRGIRWNDPAFGIEWPDDHRIISHKDLSYPDFNP